VSVDAVHPNHGPGRNKLNEARFKQEVQEIAPKTSPKGQAWVPGNAPSQVFQWSVESLAKAGTLSVIGVYPGSMRGFPMGDAMEKNLTIRSGNCNHRRYIPKLVALIRAGMVDPSEVLTEIEPLMSALQAYEAFDRREPGWIKVELKPESSHAQSARA
jgi:threonine dehydrogenase-like Zn-dependent dehydrogenase